MISEIVTSIGEAMTGFVTSITTALTNAFSGLFWQAGEAGAGQLTLLAQGLLAIVGISLVVGCVMKVYHIFSGRVRKSI